MSNVLNYANKIKIVFIHYDIESSRPRQEIKALREIPRCFFIALTNI